VAYELSEYGRELEPMLIGLGRWGARSLAEPRSDEVMNADSLSLALRDSFRPEATRGLRATYEVRLGEVIVHARVENGTLQLGRGPAASPDLAITTDLTIGRLIAGELAPADAVASGKVQLAGKRSLFDRFAKAFHFSRA
jgi:putative sterol carrier protein